MVNVSRLSIVLVRISIVRCLYHASNNGRWITCSHCEIRYVWVIWDMWPLIFYLQDSSGLTSTLRTSIHKQINSSVCICAPCDAFRLFKWERNDGVSEVFSCLHSYRIVSQIWEVFTSFSTAWVNSCQLLRSKCFSYDFLTNKKYEL